MNKNLRIWEKVKETDPNHTKPVTLGRKFTTIDAMYIIQRATEEFGPVGEGWGWEADTQVYLSGPEPIVVSSVHIWHGDRSNHYGPFTSVHPLYNSKKRLDSDAPKKATTDALTKGLSHLGFGADVFLGMYDDNKYMAELREKHGNKDLGDALPSFDKEDDF